MLYFPANIIRRRERTIKEGFFQSGGEGRQTAVRLDHHHVTIDHDLSLLHFPRTAIRRRDRTIENASSIDLVARTYVNMITASGFVLPGDFIRRRDRTERSKTLVVCCAGGKNCSSLLCATVAGIYCCNDVYASCLGLSWRRIAR